MKTFLFLTANLALSLAVAEVRNARVYKIGDETKILFTQTTEVSENSAENRTWSSVLRDSSGKILMTLTILLIRRSDRAIQKTWATLLMSVM